MPKLSDIITQADEEDDEPVRTFCCVWRWGRRNRSACAARQQSSRRGQQGQPGVSGKNGPNKFGAVVPVCDSTEGPGRETGDGDTPRLTPKRTASPSQEDTKASDRSLHVGHLGPQVGDLIGRKTLVLDLDETLIHSSFKPVANADIVITVALEGEHHPVYVRKRPGVDAFLESVSKLYEVVVFTASIAMYANPVMDKLDPHGYVSFRLFRQACTKRPGGYTKDLSLIGRDLKSVIIIDNSPVCYAMQPYNAIPISTWRHDPMDTQLYDLIPILTSLVDVDDVPNVLRQTVWAIED